MTRFRITARTTLIRFSAIIMISVLYITNVCAQEVRITADSFPYRFGKGWKYLLEDSVVFSTQTYNDSTWKPAKINIPLHDSEYKDFNGIVWFRLTFTTDSGLVKERLVLMLNHSGASEVYLDGVLLMNYGVIKTRDSTEYFDPNSTPIALPALNEGKHVLAIRYANYNAQWNSRWLDTDNAGFSGSIGRADESMATTIESAAVFISVYVVMVGIFIVLAFLHFCLWMFYKQDRSNLYFSIFAGCFALFFVCCFAVFVTNNVNINLYSNYLMEPLMALVFVALCVVVREIFAQKEKVFVSIIMVLFIVSIVLKIANSGIANLLIIVVILCVALYSIIFIFLGVRKGIPGSKILGAGILLGLLVATLILGNVQINGSSTIGQVLLGLLLLSTLSIPGSMSLYLSWNYSRINRDLRGQLEQVKTLSERTIEQEQEKLKLISSQNEMLEQKVEERTFQLQTEKKKSDTLLLNILPEEVAEELKNTGSAEAKQYNHVSVLFTDFVNFTGLSERMTPTELVQEIHRSFTAFDAIIDKHGLEKIKTIGDAYMAVCGLPNEVPDHAQRVIKAALDIRNYMEHSGSTFQIRMGIHTGAVVAGIVGVKKYAYDIWGDTVNTAA
ncbi:MAG: adenylate/guanylate cyclase domain-containing protein, partial [Bacteroidota bacterium]